MANMTRELPFAIKEPTEMPIICVNDSVVKKMISLKGDLIVGEKSIPIYFGIKKLNRGFIHIMTEMEREMLTILALEIH